MAVKFNEAGFTKRQLLERQRVALESERSPFISLWRMLNDYILPTRARFTLTEGNRGDRRSRFIIDSTGTLAARTLSSGMMSGITSPARPWFRLTTPDPDLAEHASVKEWLFACTDRIRWILSRSNFYNKAPLIYGDLGVFATGGVACLEDDHKVVRFQDFPVGSFMMAVNDSGVPNVFMRELRMSVRQLAERFGIEKCSLMIQNHYRRSNLEVLIDVVHAVEPNEEHNPNSIYAKDNMPFYSCYYERNSPQRQDGAPAFLRESGFQEFPGMFPRWEVTADDVYGTNSPGITALGDIKQLQQGEKTSLQAIEKMVKPPMTGPTSLKSVRASTLPSEITYLDVREGQQGFRPVHEVRFDVDKLEGKQSQTRGRIDRSFFADLFLMLTYMDDQRDGKQPVTAAEIYERHEEKLLALGPVLEQLNQDLLDPVIDRTFAIASRRGLIPEAPREIQGVELKVEYISTLHQAQKSTALGGMRSLMEFVLPLAERDPSVFDKIDTDKMIDHVGDAAGVPPDVIVPQDEVIEIRKARAQQAQEQRQAEQIAQQAKAAKDLAGAKTGEKNALTDLQNSGLPGGPMPTAAGAA